MDPDNNDSPFTKFCLSYLTPICDLSFIDISPFRERPCKNVDIPKKRPAISVFCNCKKSQCNKMYCECFSRGKYCTDCGCIGCKNVPIPKLGENTAPKKGSCSCKRSSCSKRHCDCFQANRRCSENCRCESCKN